MCYSPDEIDALARYACETVVAEPGKVCPYDVEAFRRIERRPVPTGEYPLYEPPAAVGGPLPDSLPQECVSNEPYHLRIGGFRRADVFGPDEAAGAISSAGIKFSDSLGEGLFEHLVLCRKYGVTPVFEAPAMGFPFPFLENELPTFERLYRRGVCGLDQARGSRVRQTDSTSTSSTLGVVGAAFATRVIHAICYAQTK